MANRKPEESSVMFLIALGLLLVSLAFFFSTDVGLTVAPRMADAVQFQRRAPISESLAPIEVASSPLPAYEAALTPPPADLISPFHRNFLTRLEAIGSTAPTTNTTSGGVN